jgi:hypothetical protein
MFKEKMRRLLETMDRCEGSIVYANVGGGMGGHLL